MLGVATNQPQNPCKESGTTEKASSLSQRRITIKQPQQLSEDASGFTANPDLEEGFPYPLSNFYITSTQESFPKYISPRSPEGNSKAPQWESDCQQNPNGPLYTGMIPVADAFRNVQDRFARVYVHTRPHPVPSKLKQPCDSYQAGSSCETFQCPNDMTSHRKGEMRFILHEKSAVKGRKS